MLNSGLFRHLRGVAVVHELVDEEEMTAGVIPTALEPASVVNETPECPICFEELPE